MKILFLSFLSGMAVGKWVYVCVWGGEEGLHVHVSSTYLFQSLGILHICLFFAPNSESVTMGE